MSYSQPHMGMKKLNNSSNEKLSYNDVIDQNLSPIFHLDDYYKNGFLL